MDAQVWPRPAPSPRPTAARALVPVERERVVTTLHDERDVDLAAPAAVYGFVKEFRTLPTGRERSRASA